VGNSIEDDSSDEVIFKNIGVFFGFPSQTIANNVVIPSLYVPVNVKLPDVILVTV
jgi:hypothetical protein